MSGTEFDKVMDSGEREEFPTGSVRDTRQAKGRYDLIPAYSMHRLAVHYENGARKYGDRNWEKGQPASRYLDSCIRHAFQLLAGDKSEDHAAAIAWNAFGLMWTVEMVRRGKLPKKLADLAEDLTNDSETCLLGICDGVL